MPLLPPPTSVMLFERDLNWAENHGAPARQPATSYPPATSWPAKSFEAARVANCAVFGFYQPDFTDQQVGGVVVFITFCLCACSCCCYLLLKAAAASSSPLSQFLFAAAAFSTTSFFCSVFCVLYFDTCCLRINNSYFVTIMNMSSRVKVKCIEYTHTYSHMVMKSATGKAALPHVGRFSQLNITKKPVTTTGCRLWRQKYNVPFPGRIFCFSSSSSESRKNRYTCVI